jgi:hypothetical protein
MYSNDYEYARTRLEGTIVRELKTGEPVYVHSISQEGVCLVAYLKNGDLGLADSHIHLDDINCKPVPLGYVNTHTRATYLMRMPLRRDWKQGLRAANCLSSGRNVFNICNKALRNCIKNEYPSFKEVVAELIGTQHRGMKIKAFHRHWAISSNGLLLYRNLQEVGIISRGKPLLKTQFNYLKESLSEIV